MWKNRTKISGKKTWNLHRSFNAKLKWTTKKFTVSLPLGLKSNCFDPTQILTHSCILNKKSQRFLSKKTCEITNLKKSLIAGNYVYLNCRHFYPSKPIDECKIWDHIIRRYENRRTKIWGKKTWNLYPSFNAKLKYGTTKFTLSLPFGLISNSFSKRQF